MGAKKQPGRFTIQFSQEDPQQRMVAEMLEEKGRRKAQFITSAVLHYVQGAQPQPSGNAFVGVDKTTLENMILEVLKKHPQFASFPQERFDTQDGSEVDSWDGAGSEDALAAISYTLAAFRQE